MNVVGYFATVLAAIIVVVLITVVILSFSGIRRYLRIRKM
ncbi:MAG: DUF6893 family small protein [Pseudonocardiaceae bacterium]